jgi:hypothetical protein
VGRDDDVAAVADLVHAEGVRLVTLTGPGGVGKSRLAVEVAQRVGPGFRDGVRFVALGSVRTAEVVTTAIAAALGLNTSGGRLITDLKSYLHARQLVLVLDNFEQVMGAAPVVAELLGAAPGVVTPQARSCKPRAAAGCTHSCPAPRTTRVSWPRCAPGWEMQHSSRPGRGAGRWVAAVPLSTCYRKHHLTPPGRKARREPATSEPSTKRPSPPPAREWLICTRQPPVLLVHDVPAARASPAAGP